jgi:hypothetical protein
VAWISETRHSNGRRWAMFPTMVPLEAIRRLGRSRAEGEMNDSARNFEVAHVLFVAVRRCHTEPEGFRHARNVAAE